MKKLYLILLLLLLIPIATADLEDLIPTLSASNSVLVAGDKADAMDWIGAAKIATTLTTTTEETTTTTTSTKDSYSIAVHQREDISDGQAYGRGYLDILNDGTLVGRNTAKTIQYLTLSNTADVRFTDYNDLVSDYLIFSDDEPAYTYRMDFTPRANADETGADFEGETISILGRDYRITDVDVSGDKLAMRLISGDVKDTLEEGRASTYTVNGATISISVDVVTINKVRMTINNKEMDPMEQDKIYAIPGTDMYIGIGEILENEVGEAGAGIDLVEFYVGANLLELEDDDIDDDQFYSDGLTFNSKRISDMYVKISGTTDSSDVYLSSIAVEWRPSSETNVKLGKGLTSYADEGQMFTSTNTYTAFDVVLDSEVGSSKEEISFRPSGADEYKLSFESSTGECSVTAYEMDGVAMTTKVKHVEGNAAVQGDYIVFSKNKNSVVAKVVDITADAAGSGSIRLNNQCGSSNTYTLINHVASIVWHGNTYTLTEQALGAQVILTDTDGDGSTGSNVGIWTKYKGEIRVGYDRAWAAIDGVTFLEHEDGKEETNHRGSTEILVNEINNVIYAKNTTFTDSFTINFYSQGDRSYAKTLWGTYVVDNLDTQKEITITYPENQLNYNVLLTGGDITQVTTSKKAKAEWSILTDQISDNRNLIIVGGPCANEVAYSLLEADKCNDGFVEGESMIKLIDLKTGYYAIVIAGYSKNDTSNAVYAFNNLDLTGKEVKLRGRTIT